MSSSRGTDKRPLDDPKSSPSKRRRRRRASSPSELDPSHKPQTVHHSSSVTTVVGTHTVTNIRQTIQPQPTLELVPSPPPPPPRNVPPQPLQRRRRPSVVQFSPQLTTTRLYQPNASEWGTTRIRLRPIPTATTFKQHQQKQKQKQQQPVNRKVLVQCLLVVVGYVLVFFWLQPPPQSQQQSQHTILHNNRHGPTKPTSNVTLRDFLNHPDGFYLSMAPSFFGFYGYFGALAAWDDDDDHWSRDRLRGTTGASAGAMAAILLAAGVPAQAAVEVCQGMTLSKFADGPGWLGMFRGNKLEDILQDFLFPLQWLEEASIPVAVTGFDLQSLSTKVLTRGSMARAARASACFPFLFEPVGWMTTKETKEEHYILVDGGIQDSSGILGLSELFLQSRRRRQVAERNGDGNNVRVINMVVGDFFPWAPGPEEIPVGDNNDNNVTVTEVLSISILNLPNCGPWAMSNGPRAVEGARLAMTSALDAPLTLLVPRGGAHDDDDGGGGRRHYELRLDASSFVPKTT